MEFLEAMHSPRRAQQADYWRWWGAGQGGPSAPQALITHAANLAILRLSVSHAHVKTGSPDMDWSIKGRRLAKLRILEIRLSAPQPAPALGCVRAFEQ